MIQRTLYLRHWGEIDVYYKKEEGIFLLFFNRDGYVMDLRNNMFDVVTNSIGEAVHTKYGLPK